VRLGLEAGVEVEAVAAPSAEECSEGSGRLEFVLNDPARNASLTIAVPQGASQVRTLGDVLSFYRASAENVDPGQPLEWRRFADSLFLLNGGGLLGPLDPGLRFRIGRRVCDLDRLLDAANTTAPVRIEIDRSCTGYTRNWPAYLARRWALRADAYSRFVECVVDDTYGRDAGAVLRLDTPDRVHRFLAAVARRIYAAPYETYSRYLEPCAPFGSCDQTLDRILEGDGGTCAEKAMALYFIARAYGIPAEVVLGGEEAAGSFPYRTLRSMLDRHTFEGADTQNTQRYWQHYAILCPWPGNAEEYVFCDVAGSNIPFICCGALEARAYLDPERREAIRVTITLEPIRLYYHRLARRQDLPLDLYYAMEHFIDLIDVIQTFDNELGLLHAGDYWVGAVAYRGPRALRHIMDEYERFVLRAGRDPRSELCFTEDFASARHPLHDQFLAAYPRGADQIIAADARIRHRVRSADQSLETCYVIMSLPNEPDARE
jgi:hypothetical protein